VEVEELEMGPALERVEEVLVTVREVAPVGVAVASELGPALVVAQHSSPAGQLKRILKKSVVSFSYSSDIDDKTMNEYDVCNNYNYELIIFEVQIGKIFI
jgi:hypothetical protein